MLEIKPIYPAMIYDVKYDNFNKVYYLEPYLNMFNEPPKYYGSTIRYSEHFFNTFKNSTTNMGILFVGSAGSGKSIMAEKIANIGLREGYKVVRVVNVKIDIKLIDFLDTLDRSIILLDEFGKNFYHDMQNKMLSMLSNTSGGKKLFILTENSKHSISNLILNRPGRVRYRLYFGKVEEDVLIEYAKDNYVDNTFLLELIELYEKSATFSFDHMQAIISEHLISKSMTLKELLNILNLDILGGNKIISLVDIIKLDDNSKIEFVPMNIQYVDWFQSNERRYHINLKTSNDVSQPGLFGNSNSSISFTAKDVTKSVGDEIMIEKDGYKIHFVIMDS